MLISDYIAQHGADTVANILRSTPAFQMFNLCWHSPADILPACTALGLMTLDDAKDYALSLYGGRAATFAQLARPRPALDENAPVTVWPEIHNMFGDAGMLALGALVTHNDRNYLKPSRAEVVALAAAFPGRNRKYIPELHDCDDFTDEFLGWLASIGYGGWAFGFGGILQYDGADNLIQGHAVAVVLTRDAGLLWVEPQGGHVYPLDYKAFAGQWFCTKVLVHTLIF